MVSRHNSGQGLPFKIISGTLNEGAVQEAPRVSRPELWLVNRPSVRESLLSGGVLRCTRDKVAQRILFSGKISPLVLARDVAEFDLIELLGRKAFCENGNGRHVS